MGADGRISVFDAYREKQRISRAKGMKKIVVYDATTNEKIGVYDDVETVASEFHICEASIIKVLHQFKYQCKGYHFEYYWSSLNKKWKKKSEQRDIPTDKTPIINKRKEKLKQILYEEGK